MSSVEAFKKRCSEHSKSEREAEFAQWPEREGLLRTLVLESPVLLVNMDALDYHEQRDEAVIIDVPAPGLYQDRPRSRVRRWH